MSAKNRARREANVRKGSYRGAIIAALTSDDMTHVDASVARILPCPVCGNLILGSCAHYAERLARRARLNR